MKISTGGNVFSRGMENFAIFVFPMLLFMLDMTTFGRNKYLNLQSRKFTRKTI